MLVRIIIVMVASAGNSILCQLTLKGMHADATSFSSLRLISGIVALSFFIAIASDSRKFESRWLNTLLLYIYVFSLSIAYVPPSTGVGTLLFPGTVQLVTTVWRIAHGEKLVVLEVTGILGALAGVAILLFPGAGRPSLYATIIMVIAELAWALYSVAGKETTGAAASTRGNFILSISVALIISLFFHSHLHIDIYGLVLDVLFGAVTSGNTHLLWYSLLLLLRSTTTSTTQLGIPYLATLGGTVFLGETLTVRVLLADVIILAGIDLVILSDMREGSKQTN